MSIALSRWGVRGTVGVLCVPVEVVNSLWVTLMRNIASNANAMCMLNVRLVVRVSSVLNPHARLALPYQNSYIPHFMAIRAPLAKV